jgi:hypothetical protein
MSFGSRPFRASLAVIGLAAAGAGAWTYLGLQPHRLVDGSAYTYYKANVATNPAVEAQKVVLTHKPSGYLWADLTPGQHEILKPLEGRWDHLTKYQRRALLQTAEKYPKLTPEQQKRYTERLVEWTHLTRAERIAVRKTYRQLAALAPEKQAEVSRAWRAEREPAEGTLTPASHMSSTGEAEQPQ